MATPMTAPSISGLAQSLGSGGDPSFATGEGVTAAAAPGDAEGGTMDSIGSFLRNTVGRAPMVPGMGLLAEAAGAPTTLADLYDEAFGDGEDSVKVDTVIDDATRAKNLARANFFDPNAEAVGAPIGQPGIPEVGVPSMGGGEAGPLVRKTAGDEERARQVMLNARTELDDARDDLLRAEDEETKARFEQSEELADMRGQEVDAIKGANEEAQRVFREHAAESRANLDEYHAATIRFMAIEVGDHPTRRQNTMRVIGLAFGAFGAHMRANKTGLAPVNVAAQIIQQGIDNDIREQKLELSKAGADVKHAQNAVSIARGIFSDERQMMTASRTMMMKMYEKEISFVTQRTNSAIIKAQGEKVASGLKVQYTTADRDLYQKEMASARAAATSALSTDASLKNASARARGNAELKLAVDRRKRMQAEHDAGTLKPMTQNQFIERVENVGDAWNAINKLNDMVTSDDTSGFGWFQSSILRSRADKEPGLIKTGIRALTLNFPGGFSDAQRDRVIEIDKLYLGAADAEVRSRSGAQVNETEVRNVASQAGASSGSTLEDSVIGIRILRDKMINNYATLANQLPQESLKALPASMRQEMAKRGMIWPSTARVWGISGQ